MTAHVKVRTPKTPKTQHDQTLGGFSGSVSEQNSEQVCGSDGITAETILADLSSRGILVTVAGDAIKLRAPSDTLTDATVEAVRRNKLELLRLLRLAEGPTIDEEAAAMLAMDEVDPAVVPTCPSCGRTCDVQSLDDRWHCSRCDSRAAERRRQTSALIRAAELIRYTDNRNG